MTVFDERVDNMDIVKASFFTPMGNTFTVNGEESWGLPILFMGPPGSSKTSRFYEFTKRLHQESLKSGVPFESVKPGSRGESFFGCTPTVSEYGGHKVLNFPLPQRFVEKFSSGAGLILIDEMLNTPPAVKPALLGFLQERELGEYKFGARVRIFGAANTVAESPSGYDLSPPEANRMGHLPWPDPSIADVISFLTSAGNRNDDGADRIDVEAEERRVLSEFYSTHYPFAAGLVAGYLTRDPSALRKQPDVGNPEASSAWASPRTWEYATRALASAACHRLNQSATETFVASFIGHAVAHQFFVWRRKQDLPSPEEILDGKVKFLHERTRLDRTAVVLHSCVAFVSQPDLADKSNRSAAIWKLIDSIVDDAADLAVPAVAALHKAKLTSHMDAKKVLAKMEPVSGANRR